MKISGAQIVIETLLEQGVDTVFGFPGATVIDIYDKLFDCGGKIKHVLASDDILFCFFLLLTIMLQL